MIDFRERALISRIRAGRADAYAEVYDRYAVRLMGYARHLTGDASDAEDLVQDTLYAAWQGRESCRGTVKLLSWLLGIMSRRWRDRCRSRQSAAGSLSIEDAEERFPGVMTSATQVESGVINRLTVDEALAAIPLSHREAVLLIHAQGLTYAEAAQVLAEPIGTVKWRVSEALKQMRRRLTAREEELDGLQQASAGSVV